MSRRAKSNIITSANLPNYQKYAKPLEKLNLTLQTLSHFQKEKLCIS